MHLVKLERVLNEGPSTKTTSSNDDNLKLFVIILEMGGATQMAMGRNHIRDKRWI
jgi:hypothetical protein